MMKASSNILDALNSIDYLSHSLFASSPSRDVAQLFCDKNSSLGFINLVSTKPTLSPRSATRAPPSIVPSPTSPRTAAMKTSFNPAALSDAPWHPYAVWWCRMGVRYGLLLPLFFLGVLPLARVAVTFVYAMFVGLACAMPFMAMLAWLTWREFDHPAPATRREPRAGDPNPRRDPSAPVSEEEDEYDHLVGDDDASPVRTVAVIGGGAAGLATLRQMLAHGMDAVLFERTDNIGGLWDYNSPERSKVFRNVLQNVTKTHNRFAGHRPPKHWPIYLGHEHTLDYLRSFVDTFELKDRIRLGCEVLSCVETERGGFELAIETETVVDSPKKSTKKSKRPNNKPGGDGDVPIITEKVTRYERFDAVCVCTGQLTAPSIPDDIVGLHTFDGAVVHSSEYRDPRDLAEARVLVVGTGAASGSDIAQDACSLAQSVTVSVRTHRWMIHRGLTQVSLFLVPHGQLE